MIVVDASVVLEVLLETDGGRQIAPRLRAEQELHAPHLIDLEVAQVLRRYCAWGDLMEERARESLLDFRAMRIVRYPHFMLLDRIWELRHNFTAYDASYVAVAEILDAVLLTRDAALASSRSHRARVELV